MVGRRRPSVHKFQTSSSLKPLGQSKIKAKLLCGTRNLFGKGERKYINHPGHMAKMVAMPIYDKNLKKSSPEPEGAAPVAECVRSLNFSIRSSHRCVWCRFEPALATCKTSHVLLAGVSGGFPGVLRFAPPSDWLISI